MACNENCITLEQLYNLLDTYDFSSNVVPTGARVTIGLNTYNTYFDSSSGKGTGAWEGWAISNGANGTVNRLGKFGVYYDPSDTDFNISKVDTVGGQKSNTLTTTELPAHTHSHGVPSHSHPVTDNGHSHSAGVTAALASTTMSGAGGTTATVNSSGYSITLNKQQMRIEDSVAPTNPKTFEVFVPTVDKQAYAGLTDGTTNVSVSGSGTVTLSNHTHPLTLNHAHSVSLSTSTTGISVGNNNTESLGVTSSAGLGQPFTNLPPYIVEIPVEKIA